MKCANCGAEIKLGCVYCSVCGKEASVTRIGQQHDRFYCLIFFLIRLARTAYSSSGKTAATLPHLPLAISA